MRTELYEFDRLLLLRLGGYILQTVTDRRLSAVYHAHDFYELVWVCEGDALQIVNGREMPLAAGDAVLLRPGDAHRFVGQAENILIVSLSIRREELEVMAGAYSPALAAHILRADAPLRLSLPAHDGGIGKSEFDCKLLLSYFLRAYIDASRFAEEAADLSPQLAALAERMRERANLCEGIGAALRLSHYSQSHLSRLIRAQYGMGLKEWINELRLAEAYRELILSDHPIAMLADEVGFASPAHFSRIFKARFGMSPAALRKSKAIHTV